MNKGPIILYTNSHIIETLHFNDYYINHMHGALSIYMYSQLIKFGDTEVL